MAFRDNPTRDTIVAILVVVGAIFVLYAWSGIYPDSPLVVVESGSMMHRDNETPYGRVGTIDPGDIIAVEAVALNDIQTWAQVQYCESCAQYGDAGDVIVYRPNNDPGRTPIIHRAMAYVQVIGGGSNRVYRVEWPGGPVDFNRSGIYIPELGFREPMFTPANGFKPAASGFITKGDNPLTNSRADQAVGISQIVEADWIIGRARGEIPWFGLIKLSLAPKFNVEPPDATRFGWTRIGNAYAPADMWTMLGIGVAALLALPLALDIRRARIDREAWRERESDAQQAGAPPRFVPPDETTFMKRMAKHARTALAALVPPDDDNTDDGAAGTKNEPEGRASAPPKPPGDTPPK